MLKLIRSYFKPVELKGDRFRITPLTHDGFNGYLTGRMYQLEAMDEAGLWHKVPKVKSVTFRCDTDGPACLTVEYLSP